MSIAVVPADDDHEEVSKPPAKQLPRLREAIQNARAKRHFERPVFGMENLVVRFRAIGEDEREKIVEKHSKGNPPAARYLINAALVATACIGIYERDGDELVTRGEFLQADGDEPLTFSDTRFQDLIGITQGSAPAAVRAFYGTDNGDVIGLGDEIVQFSGFLGAEIAEAVRGNS